MKKKEEEDPTERKRFIRLIYSRARVSYVSEYSVSYVSRLISEFRFISFLAVFTVFDCQHVFDAIMVP